MTMNYQGFFSTPDESINKFPFAIKFATVQGWFVRASWFTKVHFISDLLNTLQGLRVLRLLLISIASGSSKDVVYAMNQNTRSHAYDVVPRDDNRDLDPVMLNETIVSDKIWFASLEPVDQLTVLIGLLQLGGGALIKRVHDETVKLVETKVYVNEILEHSYPSGKSKTSSVPGAEAKLEETTTSQTSVEGKRRSAAKKKIVSNKSSKRKGKTKSQSEKKASKSGGEEERSSISKESEGRVTIFVQEEMEEIPGETILESPADILVREQLDLWQQKLHSFKVQFGIVEDDNKFNDDKNDKNRKEETKSKEQENECLDKIQMLPLWINKNIIKYLNEGDYPTARKVNRYWSFMIDDVKKEMNVRNNINTIVSKMKFVERVTSLEKVPNEEDDVLEKSFNEGEEQDTNPILDLLQLPASCISEETNMYCGRHCISKIALTFLHSRVMACGPYGKLLAVTTCRKYIIFYSLMSGSQLSPQLIGHAGVITCLCFHPEGNLILSGSYDTTIRCWDIWSQKTTKLYIGHSKTVTALCVTKDHFASCSADKKIKVFHLWSAQCLATLIDEQPLTVVKLVLSIDAIYTGSHGGEIRMYNFSQYKLIKQVLAHKNGVLALNVSPPLLLSGGGDGLVKIWNGLNLEQGCLITMDHGSPVRTIFLSYMRVLTGCTAGRLRVWCPVTGRLLKLIRVTSDSRPILQLHCVVNEDYAKVIISSETGLRIYEFLNTVTNKDPCIHQHHLQQSTVVRSKFLNMPTCKWTWNIGHHDSSCTAGQQATLSQRRLKGLGTRFCTDPCLRDDEGHHTNKSVITDAINDDIQNYVEPVKNLKSFTRYLTARKSTLHESPIRKDYEQYWRDPSATCMKNKRIKICEHVPKAKSRLHRHKFMCQAYNVHNLFRHF